MSGLKLSRVVKLSPVGNASFSAYRVNRNDYNGLLNPIMGFDDFQLSTDVFGPHQHRHMSALSYLFDDSAAYHNQDSMGTDVTITTGSLLWTWAGSGVTHHEFPEKDNTKIHGLQLFLETPVETRNLAPKSIHIPVWEMPVKDADGLCIKVVLGAIADLVNNKETPEPITFLDVTLTRGKFFQHVLPAGWNGTVYVLSGTVFMKADAFGFELQLRDTIALGASENNTPISFTAVADCHLLFISGHPVG